MVLWGWGLRLLIRDLGGRLANGVRLGALKFLLFQLKCVEDGMLEVKTEGTI